MMNFENVRIISQKEIIEDIFLLKVHCPGQQIEPGQFYMLSVPGEEMSLMRPISVFKFDKTSISFLYRLAGKGTRSLSLLKKDDRIDILGPSGNGFPCDQVSGKIALVGGGIGIPPLYETAKKLRKLGNQVDVYLGYKDDLYLLDDFEKVSDRIFVACESGREGYKGFVTHILACEQYDAVMTCGPDVMMTTVLKMCREHGIPAWASMEKRMACGIGACLVCNCETVHGMKRCCKDGPVFSEKDLIL